MIVRAATPQGAIGHPLKDRAAEDVRSRRAQPGPGPSLLAKVRVHLSAAGRALTAIVLFDLAQKVIGRVEVAIARSVRELAATVLASRERAAKVVHLHPGRSLLAKARAHSSAENRAPAAIGRSARVPVATGRVPAAIGRVPAAIGRVPNAQVMKAVRLHPVRLHHAKVVQGHHFAANPLERASGLSAHVPMASGHSARVPMVTGHAMTGHATTGHDLTAANARPEVALRSRAGTVRAVPLQAVQAPAHPAQAQADPRVRLVALREERGHHRPVVHLLVVQPRVVRRQAALLLAAPRRVVQLREDHSQAEQVDLRDVPRRARGVVPARRAAIQEARAVLADLVPAAAVPDLTAHVPADHVPAAPGQEVRVRPVAVPAPRVRAACVRQPASLKRMTNERGSFNLARSPDHRD